MDRIPPHDLTAERALLSCLLQDKGTLDKIYELLKSEDFYSDKHKKIYEAIMTLNSRNEPFDAISVGSLLETTGELSSIGGLPYILTVAGEVPVVSHAEHYAKIVTEKATLRHLIATAQEITEEVYKGEN